MGFFGLAKGLAKTAGGIITGDSEMLVKGLKKTAINAVTTTVSLCSGNFHETASEDDDPDD